MLNSLTYDWWTSKNLYIADPDHVVLGESVDQGARNVTEGRSQLLSAILSGGKILDSSRLADDPPGQELARVVYDNGNLFAVANESRAFRPMEGDADEKPQRLSSDRPRTESISRFSTTMTNGRR